MVVVGVGSCSATVLVPFLLPLSFSSLAGQGSATKTAAAAAVVVAVVDVMVVAFLFEDFLEEEGVATVSTGGTGVGSGTTDAAMEERAPDLFFRGTISSTVTTSTSEFMSRSASSCCCFSCCCCCWLGRGETRTRFLRPETAMTYSSPPAPSAPLLYCFESPEPFTKRTWCSSAAMVVRDSAASSEKWLELRLSFVAAFLFLLLLVGFLVAVVVLFSSVCVCEWRREFVVVVDVEETGSTLRSVFMVVPDGLFGW